MDEWLLIGVAYPCRCECNEARFAALKRVLEGMRFMDMARKTRTASVAFAVALLGGGAAQAAGTFTDALVSGKPSLDVRYRFEHDSTRTMP
jgi:hypothetical protein